MCFSVFQCVSGCSGHNSVLAVCSGRGRLHGAAAVAAEGVAGRGERSGLQLLFKFIRRCGSSGFNKLSIFGIVSVGT